MEGFLPPKPAGPEPELGGRPPAQPAPTPSPPVPGQEADNGPAVAGFVFSLVGAGLLFVTAGLSSLVSLGCAVAGVVYGRKGRRNVDTGVTSKHRSLAQAGWVLGWVTVGFSILATIAWTLVLVLALTSEEFRRDLERELEGRTAALVAIGTVRVAAHLLT